MIITKDFEHIYRTYFKMLFDMAYRVLLDKEDALDAVHDVMLSMYQKMDKLDEDPRGYLIVAMRNELVERLRKMDIATRHARWIADSESEVLYDMEQSESAERQERLTEINRVVERDMTPSVSRVFDAIFRHGRSYAEAAEDLNISTSAVNKHVVTALRILRDYFSKRHDI